MTLEVAGCRDYLNDIGCTPSPHYHAGCIDDGTCPPAAGLPPLSRMICS